MSYHTVPIKIGSHFKTKLFTPFTAYSAYSFKGKYSSSISPIQGALTCTLVCETNLIKSIIKA